MNNSFSKEIIDILFKVDNKNCLVTTEAYDIEYKLNFNISQELFKTMNGLANNKGGYILFGIEPNTKKIVGLEEPKVNYYLEKSDSEEMRGKIFSACQPNIEYKHCLHVINDLKVIVFYVPKSTNKPHIFSKGDGNIKEGDIFYRYNDSIKRIQYAELSAIIEEKRIKEQEKWMRFFGEISKIGLDNALIIDKKNGRLINSDSKVMTISPELLDNFKLIKEGEFVEKNGALTLKLIGNVLVQDTSVSISDSADKINPKLLPKLYPFTQKQVLQQIFDLSVETKDGIKIEKGFFSASNLQGYNIIFKVKDNVEFACKMPYGKSKNYIYSQKYVDEVIKYIKDNDMETIKKLAKFQSQRKINGT